MHVSMAAALGGYLYFRTESNEVFDDEIRAVTQDGRTLDLLVSAIMVADDSGEPVCLLRLELGRTNDVGVMAVLTEMQGRIVSMALLHETLYLADNLAHVDGGPQLRLVVSDTGPGLPADLAERREQTLGLQLVSDLARQLRGTVSAGDGPGTQFTLVFTPRLTAHTGAPPR